MKIYIIMCGTKEEVKELQQENWMALGRMGITSRIDFRRSSIIIADEIELLHLSPDDSDRLYGLKIDGFKTFGTFGTTNGSEEIFNRLKLCVRR